MKQICCLLSNFLQEGTILNRVSMGHVQNGTNKRQNVTCSYVGSLFVRTQVIAIKLGDLGGNTITSY